MHLFAHSTYRLRIAFDFGELVSEKKMFAMDSLVSSFPLTRVGTINKPSKSALKRANRSFQRSSAAVDQNQVKRSRHLHLDELLPANPS